MIGPAFNLIADPNYVSLEWHAHSVLAPFEDCNEQVDGFC